MPGEFHISSVVVHALPEALERVGAGIAAIPGAEVHARSPQGKLVLTLEAQDEATIMQCLDRINGLPGVLAATLVYHHWEQD